MSGGSQFEGGAPKPRLARRILLAVVNAALAVGYAMRKAWELGGWW